MLLPEMRGELVKALHAAAADRDDLFSAVVLVAPAAMARPPV